jgi:hypothetical protein
MFVVAIYDGKRSKAAYAPLLSRVDRQVERLNALWYSAWRNDLEFVTMFLDLGVKLTQYLVSQIESRGVEQERGEDIAAEVSRVHLDSEGRGHQIPSEILALLKANM